MIPLSKITVSLYISEPIKGKLKSLNKMLIYLILPVSKLSIEYTKSTFPYRNPKIKGKAKINIKISRK